MHLTRVDNSVFAPSANLVGIVIDEVALEGLDGITLDTLWLRLGIRLQVQEEFPPAFKEQVWTICTSTRGIDFYILESPRPPLVLYDRYEYVDPDLGIITEPDDVPDDIYEYHPIEDVKNGITGSCQSYYTRKLEKAVSSLSLGEAGEKYGSSLVIVASQELRQQALIGDCVCPTLELSVVQFCFLERVGRSRYHGEVTQGKHSLSVLNEDPKTLFYYRKLLLKHKLITKQAHYQKTSGHGSAGSLMHLPRFYVERKPKMVFLAERIIEMLKSRENYLVDYREIKKELQIENSIKRLFKTSFFQKVARTDLKVRYRVLYPNAPDSEWQRKGLPSKEKVIQAVQLIDPKVDANTLWNKEDNAEDEDCYDLDVSNQLLFEPLLKQANGFVERANVDGISQRDLGVQMGITKLQSRTMLRNLSKLNVIGTYMNDSGRQRVGKFVSKKYEKRSMISKQFNSEIRKMKKLRKETLNEAAKPLATTAMDFFYPLGAGEENINISLDNKTVEAHPAIEYPTHAEKIDDPPPADPNLIVNDFETVDIDAFKPDNTFRFKEDLSEEQTFADTKGQIVAKVIETTVPSENEDPVPIEASRSCQAKDCNVNIEMEIENTPIKLEALNIDRYHLFSVANKVLKKYSRVKSKGKVQKRSHFKVGFFNVAHLDVARLTSLAQVKPRRRRSRGKVKFAGTKNSSSKARNSGTSQSDSAETQECILPESFESNPSVKNSRPESAAVDVPVNPEDHILPEQIPNAVESENVSRKRPRLEEPEDSNAKRIKISSNLFYNQPESAEMNAVINIEPEDDYNSEFYNQGNYYNDGYYNQEEYYSEGYNPENYNAEGYNPGENYSAEGHNLEENFSVEDSYDSSWVDDEEKIIDATATPTPYSYRMLKRLNMIITMVKEHKVIDDPAKLMKMINQAEEREGYEVKMDKKSLMRMLQKLARDNLVKNMKLTLSANGRKKVLFFVCDKNTNVNHSVIQSAVEQAKIKFCLTTTNRKIVKMNPPTRPAVANEPAPAQDPNVPAISEKNDHRMTPADLKYDLKAGRDYGYKPKFIRMKVIHKLLYYLVYEYKGENLSKLDQIERLRAEGNEITDKMAEEMAEIYHRDVDWRMFIPPLPQHSGWGNGWAMICDIILRLPLSIFLEVHKLPFYVPDLNYYVGHPIRKHYLMKDLPICIRNALLMKRKYIYSVFDTIQRLSYIGLVQFGPQKFKEKDQVFIYLNTRSQLVDTTSSAPGYHKIEEKTYPVQSYSFDRLQTVENYWYDMWQICVCTRLGGRQAVEGTEITLEDLTKKPEMIQCLVPRSPEEASAHDLGVLPGDKKGAAGIDSAFFSHLKRNWNWENYPSGGPLRAIKKHSDWERSTRLSKIEAKPIKFTEFKGLKKVTGPVTVSAAKLQEKKPKANTAPPKLVASAATQRPDKIVRKVMPRKRQQRKRVHYDEIDYKALEHMKKLRVDWDTREDNILVICKIVMTYLSPHSRAQQVPFSAVRDVLRAYSKSSYNKTSRACQRRLLYLYKRTWANYAVTVGVEELKEDPYIHRKYRNIVKTIRSTFESKEQLEKIASVFKTIFHYVARRHHISQRDPPESSLQPATLGEFHLLYEISSPEKPYANQGFIKPVQNVNDIYSATINSVIFSSMCSGKDRRSWAYQLFRIYQQYPEILLKNAMTKIRADGMVSLKRYFKSVMKKIGSGSCMPMTSSQYQLSTAYIYKFQSKLSLEVFREAQVFLQRLIEGYSNNSLGQEHGVEFNPPNGGVVLGVQEFLANQNLDFNIKIPDHVIVLDSKLQEYDRAYLRIAKRYQDILCSLEKPKTGQDQETKAQDSEPREEIPESCDSPADISIVSVKTQGKKAVFKKDSWGWPKSDTSNTTNPNSNLNSDGNDQNDPQRTVRGYTFQLDDSDDESELKVSIDGREIKITKSDIDHNKSCFIDNEMHEAFKQTRLGNLEDLPDIVSSDDLEEDPREALMHLVNHVSMGTSIDELNRIVNEHIPMDGDDERVDKPNVRLRAMAAGERDRDRFEFVNVADFNNVNEDSDGRRNNSNMVNDIIANVGSCNEPRVQSSGREEDSYDTQKKHTRIALLQVREELNEKLHNLPDSHHAHEYFVVSTFGLYYSMPKIDKEIIANPDFVIDDRVKENLFLLKNNSYKNVVSDLNKFAVFPKDPPDYETVKEELESQSVIESFEIDLIYDYVRNKREQGATLKELTNKFYRVLEEKLYDILSYMTNCRLFLRSGITEMHYIHYFYAEPWYVQSIKILRLQRESLPPFPPGSVYVFNSANNYTLSTSVLDRFLSEKTNKVVDFGDCIDNDHVENQDDEDDNEENENNLEIDADNAGINKSSNDSKGRNLRELKNTDMKLLNQRSTRGNMRCLLQTKDIYTAVKKLDLNSAEKINVIVRPWIQIDGAINRMMLEKMLGAILSHCLMHPGIALSQVQTRFVPALQPYHTRELIEILVKLDCLSLRIIRKSPGTLFSNGSSIKLYYPARADGSSELDGEIIIEATTGATIKFGTFVRYYLSRKTNVNSGDSSGETGESEPI